MKLKKKLDIPFFNIFASIFFISLITFIAFIPSFNNGFTNWDDGIYIYNNRMIQDLSWKNIKLIFTTFYATFYHPITLLTYAIDYHFSGLDPFIYHVTNFVFHLLNTLLVFWFIFLITGRVSPSFITSVLFGIHPLHVESVAWVSERKDVVSTLFFLGTLISYIYYRKNDVKQFYYISIVIFIMSLLSKPIAITIPFMIILCDYILEKKNNISTFLEKIPFFLMALVFVYITMCSTHYADNISYGYNSILIPSYALVFYMVKLFLPVHLSAIYPYPTNIFTFKFLISPLIIIISFFILIYLRNRRKIIFAFTFFFINLLPVLQIVPNTCAVAADRYVYIPSIGIFYLVGEFFLWIYSLKNSPVIKIMSGVVLITIILILSYLTYHRCGVWKDNFTLWNDVLSQYPYILQAYVNRGDAYKKIGEHEKAIADLNQALNIDPRRAEVYATRGSIYMEIKEYDKSMADLNYALKLKSDLPAAYINRGNLYRLKGDYNKAISDYREALKLKPGYVEVYYNRAVLYDIMKDYNKSLADYTRAIEYKPDYVEALYNRGIIYDMAGDYNKAIADFTQAIKYKADYLEAYQNRGNIYYKTGNHDNALNDFNRLLTLKPEFTKGYISRGTVYADKNRYSDALTDFNKAIEIDPRSIEAFNGRGAVYGLMNEYDRAIDDFTEAISLDETSIQSYYNRAFTYMKKGDFKEARKDVEKLAKLGYKVDKSVFKGIY
ncbi:MAG: tetratricopeptide repeat protein [Candidatus Eremiobacterota bacterium]